MKAISAPAGLALLLCLAGALGLGPSAGGAATALVVDVSPSCEPPDPLPDGAIVMADSRLGAALRDAARVPGTARIRLLTDACDLSGEAPEPPGVPVDVVLLPRRDNVAVLRVGAPGRIPPGADFAVEVVVGRTAGPPAPALPVTVALYRDGERVGAPRSLVRLHRGGTARVLVRDRVEREGSVRYRAVVDDPAGDPLDDTLEAVARIGERPVILSIGGALRAGDLEVAEVPAAEADSFLAGAAPDMVDAVLVRGTLPAAASQARIADLVRAGAGLVVLGGAGIADQPLEPVLPLTDRPPEGRAALLLLDFSGSMQELHEEMIRATDRLLSHFAPSDRVAYVAFRDRPIAASGWSTVAAARWDLRSSRPHGNTLLGPALREAERLLGEVEGERRLFVVSDGKWGDRDGPDLAEGLARLGGVYRAALFVSEDTPPESLALFPESIRAEGDLPAALRRLEDAAGDRVVRQAEAVEAPAPAWLQGAAPAAGTYRDFARLYPRGVGERVVLGAGAIPIVAAWRPVGKVVVAAPLDIDPLPLVRAVLKEGAGMRLRAWRDGDGLVAEADLPGVQEMTVDGAPVAARPVGPARSRAVVARIPFGAVRVACGEATVIVPPLLSLELRGLGNRPDIAATIAAASGGTLLEPGEASVPARREGMAPWATLLAAAVLVVASAWRRRRA